MPHIPGHREESFSKKNKIIIMAQLEKGLQNKSSINRTQYPIHLRNQYPVAPGLRAGVRSQAHKILVNHVF